MTIEVKSNVPLPTRGSGRDWKTKYPFARMDVGDMFEIEDPDSKKAATRLQSAGRNFAKRTGLPWKFAVRTTPKGAGIWRVE